MPGASAETRRVKTLNANWHPADDGAEHDHFEVQIITDDEQRHAVAVSPASMAALVALAKADTAMAWDPQNRALIVANIVGTMPWTVDDDA